MLIQERQVDIAKEEKDVIRLKQTILDNADWTIQREGDNLYIAYFEDGHFRDDITIPIGDITGKQTDEQKA